MKLSPLLSTVHTAVTVLLLSWAAFILNSKPKNCSVRLSTSRDTAYFITHCKRTVCHSGGFRGGAAAPPLASFRKIQGLPISKIVRTAGSTIIIITDFHLAASSHEIFLRVRGREGMKGLGALQRHQLPHPPCKNPGSATGLSLIVFDLPTNCPAYLQRLTDSKAHLFVIL